MEDDLASSSGHVLLPMLRVEHSLSMGSSLLGALDSGFDWAVSIRALGRYLMPQLKVTGLAQPIVPLVPGNSDLASNLYRNHFALAGAEVSAGTGSVFALTPPTEAWAAELHGFGWLLDIAAGGLEMHRAF